MCTGKLDYHWEVAYTGIAYSEEKELVTLVQSEA